MDASAALNLPQLNAIIAMIYEIYLTRYNNTIRCTKIQSLRCNLSEGKEWQVLTIVVRAKGNEIPANSTRKARSPTIFSPLSRRLAIPLWTTAKMMVRSNMTT
jgi:hypothetical protein